MKDVKNFKLNFQRLKIIMFDRKNILQKINSRLDDVEEMISKLEVIFVN